MAKFEHLTSLGGTSKIFDAAKNMSGAGFRFSNASADTIASNLVIEQKFHGNKTIKS